MFWLPGQKCPLLRRTLECKAFIPPQVPACCHHAWMGLFGEGTQTHQTWGSHHTSLRMQSHHTEEQVNTEAETVLYTKPHSSQVVSYTDTKAMRHPEHSLSLFLLHTHTHTHTHAHTRKNPICDLALHKTLPHGRIINKTCF